MKIEVLSVGPDTILKLYYLPVVSSNPISAGTDRDTGGSLRAAAVKPVSESSKLFFLPSVRKKHKLREAFRSEGQYNEACLHVHLVCYCRKYPVELVNQYSHAHHLLSLLWSLLTSISLPDS